MQQQEKAIFQNYEIRNWNYSTRLYKILGAAAIFNLMTILVLAQTDVLTARGCDSPFVGRVCQVIDTIYVGSTLVGTDSEFVSKDYEKNELDDADITYIDVSSASPPLTYPEGYFAIANPYDNFTAMQNPTNDFSMTNPIPGFSGYPTINANPTDLMAVPQVTPTPNNKAIQGAIPTSPFSMGDNPVPMPNATITTRKFPRTKPSRNISPDKLPNLDGEKIAGIKEEKVEKPKEEIKSDPVAEVEINKKPFEDLGDFVNESLAKNEIDLNKPFLVVMDGRDYRRRQTRSEEIEVR
jgi:hypothetical protein